MHKGAPGNEMFLISRGVCEVTITDMKVPQEEDDANMKSSIAKKRGRRRSSSAEILTGAMSNFTDFIQARNAKNAMDKSMMLKQPEREEGNIPKVRKSFKKMDSNPLRRISAPIRRVSASLKNTPLVAKKAPDSSSQPESIGEESEDDNAFEPKRKGLVDPLNSSSFKHEKVVKELVEGEVSELLVFQYKKNIFAGT